MKAQYLESAALELGEAGGWLWRERRRKKGVVVQNRRLDVNRSKP
jgi:hypothetical protein